MDEGRKTNMSEQERSYRLSQDERWPTLVFAECEPTAPRAVTVPARLMRRLSDARDALTEAEAEVARWVKYTAPERALTDIGTIVSGLPTPEERKATARR
jgi:hypothetical protein